eukprot:CAMPEP_0182442342 /NCGR_PEP_ID=MMETSP1172-20130603/1249_1 /TAXON_ID=708627 /ORGANISM="Timspurckia oligopyrenoides, Strain CCMP3278" /LENGTH=397 /DNA_ID=CAMNT_0024637129 /DNA_START=53 /DNA_END=1246 /DNA_ORIENTATION=+
MVGQSTMMMYGNRAWEVHNANGKFRVLVTKNMVGSLWLDLLKARDCRVEVCTSRDPLQSSDIQAAFGSKCDGVIGQLTEKWDESAFSALKSVGGRAFSTMAVGYDNVDVRAATQYGIPVGNTPGVLTEATAEMAVSLIYACARRVVEADAFMRAGKYSIWLPDLFIGKLLHGKTLGIIGAGRIGSAVGLMMARGAHMNVIYYDKYQNKGFEAKLESFRKALAENNEDLIEWKRGESVEDVLKNSDVVTLHPNLDRTTWHMIDEKNLNLMRRDAIIVNCARGPVIDEVALVEHCRRNPDFYAGMDVFEDEPLMKPGLKDLHNVVVVPHIASATLWTRSGMSTLAAANVSSMLHNHPVANAHDVTPYVNAESAHSVPQSAPAIVNAKDLNLPMLAKPKL